MPMQLGQFLIKDRSKNKKDPILTKYQSDRDVAKQVHSQSSRNRTKKSK